MTGRLRAALLLSLQLALVAMALASALILACGQAPLHVYRLLWAGTWGSGYGAGQVLFAATPLVFTALAVVVPLQAGLFSVGAEGQAAAGAFACGLLGAALPSSLPWPLAVPACLLAALLGGALLGVVPGILKAYRGAHEVIVTIMLNFVVAALLQESGKRFYLRETVHTAPIVESAQLPRAAALLPWLRGSSVGAALLLAVATCLLVSWLLRRSVAGFRLAAAGESPAAAEAHGIRVAAQTVLAMSLGGALAGLAGAAAVLGHKHYYEEGATAGVGFMGIAVALLGRGRAVGLLLAALLFGTLAQGGLAINAVVPRQLVDVLQAALILAVAAAARVAAGAPAPGGGRP